ncbi:hypothetical protein [[Mycobacterium] nativiensis]|uniref:Haemophore haem-binding domain-containing protein n=1 Tax=[Mycobacterium] nativiensis TaxID=2855503 RepID=A0ABU5XYA3_9MYCO|nr:hypothetical protein [Mycolicibacter sp. MYC340]MEB3031991.1 hypothetical protein [Mycolicibacter sp. MYC340]
MSLIRRRLRRRATLAGAAVAALLVTAPTTAADDLECGIIMPAADQLEREFNRIRPGAAPPAGVEGGITHAASPLFGLTSPAAVDLRLWASTLAAEVNRTNPYRPADRGQIARDLEQARLALTAAREFCG